MMAARFRSVTWVAVALVPALACYLVTQHVAAERAELAKVERRIGQTRHDIRDLETELGTRGSMAQIERWNTQTLALAAPTAQQFVNDGVQLASLTALPTVPPRAVLPAPAPAAAGTVVADVRQAAFSPAGGAVPERTLLSDKGLADKVLAERGLADKGPADKALTSKTLASKASAGGVTTARAHAEQAVVQVRQAAFEAPRKARLAEVKAAIRQAARHAQPAEEAQPMLRAANYVKPQRDAAHAQPTRVALLSGGPLDSRALADIGRIARSERGSRR